MWVILPKVTKLGHNFLKIGTFCLAANRQDQKKDPQELKSETNENWMTCRMLESAAAAAAASMHFS